jgi:hypothetical protein
MGFRIILRGGTRDGFEDYVRTDGPIHYSGNTDGKTICPAEQYRITDEYEADGRRVARPFKPDMAAVGRRVSEWANSPAGRKAIMEERPGECDAGVLHPEAPLNRFIIEHGVLHDTLIGRHVDGTNDSLVGEGPERLRDYLISLTRR